MPIAKNYKSIVLDIVQAENVDRLNKIEVTIDKSYEAGKINWRDHETLLDLIVKCSGGALYRPYVDIIKQ